MSESSPQGSCSSSGETRVSSIRGITWRRIGQSGSSRSIRLKKGCASWKQGAFSLWAENSRSIKTEQYNYILYEEPSGYRYEQLYDLLADPEETTNIAADNPDVTARMAIQDQAAKAAAAERPEVIFIDTWKRFSGRDGGWAEFVIDPRDGEGKDVRADDGFHLNQTGAEILAIDIAGDGVASPGDTLEYIISIDNVGDSPATGVVLLDPTPLHTTAVAGAAATTASRKTGCR